MDSTGPVRDQGDLAEMVELLLEKGVVINADVVVSVGDTELLGVELRAAIASFETAAKYGLEFPDGTDRERVVEAASRAGGEIDGGAGEEVPDEPDDDSGSRARSLRLRPGGPAASGGSGETVGEPPSVADKGTSELDRRTPAGAEDVAIDPAPYEPAREDLDPDVAEPGVDHPDVEDRDGDGPDGADEAAESDGDGSADAEGAENGGSVDAEGAENGGSVDAEEADESEAGGGDDR